MRALLKRRVVRAAMIVASITTIACFVSPLLAVHGVESALVFGLVLPSMLCLMACRIVLMRGERTIGSAVREAIDASVVVLAIPFFGLFFGALRARWCAPLEGLAFFLLGPLTGCALAIGAGALLGSISAGVVRERGPDTIVPAASGGTPAEIPARARLVSIFAFFLPVIVALLGLMRFYSTPAIFAYSHFVGYFPGSLYDPDISITSTYVSFRGLSACWLGAVTTLLFAWRHDARPTFASLRVHPITIPLALLFVVTAVAGEVFGPELGHRSTAASIRQALGAALEGERCTVIVPRELPREQAETLRDDCDFRVDRAEHVLGVTHPGRITAFFFRTAAEKRELMGASGTYIAKPWRDEVYLQLGLDPHPVLFHEIVHVVAAATGVGPFRISGGLGGLFPSPGIVEGVAVAVAWDSREGLTPHQWARAMTEIDRAPQLEDASGLGFLLQPAGRAYTANGSFIRWLLDTRGTAAVLTLYRTGDYALALGEPLADAEREWRAFLATVALPPQAVPLARLRFARSAIFSQVCPHAIAALEASLESDEAAGDDRGALDACDAILAIDPGLRAMTPHRIGALARLGRLDEARAALDALEHAEDMPAAVRTSGRTELADVYLSRGDLDRARELYERSTSEPISDDQARQLDVKLFGIERGARILGPLTEVLVPNGRRLHDGATTIEALSRLEDLGDDGLADYLIARQMIFRQRYDLAAPRIARARERGVPGERIQREALRIDGVVAVRIGDLDRGERIFESIAADGDEGQRVEALDWLARIRWLRAR